MRNMETEKIQTKKQNQLPISPSDQSSEDNIFRHFKENNKNLMDELAREADMMIDPNTNINRKSKNATTTLNQSDLKTI